MKTIRSLKKQKGLSTMEYAILFAAIIGIVTVLVATLGPAVQTKVEGEIAKI